LDFSKVLQDCIHEEPHFVCFTRIGNTIMLDSSNLSRRIFLRSAVVSASGAILLGSAAQDAIAQQEKPQEKTTKQRPEALKPEIVKEFVSVGHAKFDRTKEMLAETPSLLNATWDWGGGDFEMAIGGAGHMGNREIAEFLISKGARMDIFVAAMLGKLEIVRAMINAYPDLKMARGPHGISLLTHAQKGGSDAAAVVEYFRSVGVQ
jgi:hypothetical protein